jgi:hypothetical protein
MGELMGIQKGMTQKLGKPPENGYRQITRSEHEICKKFTVLIPQKGFIANDFGHIKFFGKSGKNISLSDEMYQKISYALDQFWNS